MFQSYSNGFFGTKYIHYALWTKDEGTLLNNKGLKVKGERD